MSFDIASLFRRLTSGVYVIGVSHGGNDSGFTAAWVMQVSFDPLLLAVSIHPGHASYPLLIGAGVFSVNVLPRGREDLARHFGSGEGTDKLVGVDWHRGASGTPLLEAAMAYFECAVCHDYPAGDHRLVVGRVTGGEVLNADVVPMNYRDTGDMDGSSRLYPGDFTR